MKIATVYSACECQARLGADLDEGRRVIRGWAWDSQRTERLVAPAQSIGPGRQAFDIGWSCPFCIRNTLRMFDASALAYRDAEKAASTSVSAATNSASKPISPTPTATLKAASSR
jgi:hypothetical protein